MDVIEPLTGEIINSLPIVDESLYSRLRNYAFHGLNAAFALRYVSTIVKGLKSGAKFNPISIAIALSASAAISYAEPLLNEFVSNVPVTDEILVGPLFQSLYSRPQSRDKFAYGLTAENVALLIRPGDACASHASAMLAIKVRNKTIFGPTSSIFGGKENNSTFDSYVFDGLNGISSGTIDKQFALFKRELLATRREGDFAFHCVTDDFTMDDYRRGLVFRPDFLGSLNLTYDYHNGVLERTHRDKPIFDSEFPLRFLLNQTDYNSIRTLGKREAVSTVESFKAGNFGVEFVKNGRLVRHRVYAEELNDEYVLIIDPLLSGSIVRDILAMLNDEDYESYLEVLQGISVLGATSILRSNTANLRYMINSKNSSFVQFSRDILGLLCYSRYVKQFEGGTKPMSFSWDFFIDDDSALTGEGIRKHMWPSYSRPVFIVSKASFRKMIRKYSGNVYEQLHYVV